MNPVRNDKAWMGISAQTLYVHKFAGLDGNRCGFYLPWTDVRCAIGWNSVTCPDCLKLRQAWEPDDEVVDTRGD